MAADTSTLSRPYSIAAFKQAREEGTVAQWGEMLEFLELLTADATMKGLIASPKVKEEQLAALIIDICGDRLSATERNFVKLLAEYGRLENLPEIRQVYEAERAQLEGRAEVQVTSAYELDDTQQAAIKSTMSGQLGRRDCRSPRWWASTQSGTLSSPWCPSWP